MYEGGGWKKERKQKTEIMNTNMDQLVRKLKTALENCLKNWDPSKKRKMMWTSDPG